MIVLLDIKKPMLREYLNYLFLYEDGAYSVFRTNHFGKILCALVRYNDFPVKHPQSEHTVTLKLPITPLTKTANGRFRYYTAEDQAKIIEYLDVLFNIDFDTYYMVGIKLGLQQKDVIRNFIISRKLTSIIGDNERLKKRVYRDDQKIIKKYTEALSQKVFYRNRVIENTIKQAYSL